MNGAPNHNFATLRSFIRPYNLSFQQITSNYFKFTDLGRSFQPCCQILANWSQSKVEKQITVKGSLYLIVTHGKLRIGTFVKGMGKLSIVYCNLLCFSVISLFFSNAMFFTLFYIILNLSLAFAHDLLLACGWVGTLWKKKWNSTYENNRQFISNTTEKLQMLMEHGLFNDSSKYGNVTVAELRVNEVDGYVYLSIMLCLVVKKNNTGFIEDVIKMWKKFGNENVTTDQEFWAGYFVTFGDLKAKDGECSKCSGPFGVLITLEIECKPRKAEYSCNGLKTSWENDDCVKYCGRRFGVTFGDWKAKDGECSKCSSGGAGPITLERECEPKLPAFIPFCDGLNTTMESQDCLKYCDSSAANRKFTSVFLLLAVLMSFSTSFTIWE